MYALHTFINSGNFAGLFMEKSCHFVKKFGIAFYKSYVPWEKKLTSNSQYLLFVVN